MSRATYDAMYMQYMGKGVHRSPAVVSCVCKLSESVADGSNHLKLFVSFEVFA